MTPAIAAFTAAAVLVLPTLGAGAATVAAADGEIPRAVCGPGAVPESGVQGQVPIEDRRSGHSEVARSCNLTLLGQYQGEGPQTVTDGFEAGGEGFAGFLANLASRRGTPNSLSADWCSSPPAFVRGQLWVTCQDNGFLALKFTNGAHPLD